jgi:REP element-mobilizing transposase RayT
MRVKTFVSFFIIGFSLLSIEEFLNREMDLCSDKFGNRHFWAEGYYVSTVDLKEATIRKYIQDQEKSDIMQDKLSVKEYEDPFKG